MQYKVYFLKSFIKDRYYIGYTTDVRKRLNEHNAGKTKSTKPYRPWKLIYIETFLDKNEAYKREWYLKHPKGYIEKVKIIKNYGGVAYPPKADPPRAGRSKFMYYVYILFSQKLSKRYIGSTLDLKKRLKEHNSSKSKFTANGIPWKLIYYEAFLYKGDALREEKFLKTGRGRERIKYLFGGVA